jgi:hypothetical protein
VRGKYSATRPTSTRGIKLSMKLTKDISTYLRIKYVLNEKKTQVINAFCLLNIFNNAFASLPLAFPQECEQVQLGR